MSEVSREYAIEPTSSEYREPVELDALMGKRIDELQGLLGTYEITKTEGKELARQTYQSKTALEIRELLNNFKQLRAVNIAGDMSFKKVEAHFHHLEFELNKLRKSLPKYQAQ